MKVQKDLFGKKVTPKKVEIQAEIPKERFEKKLQGFIISPTKIRNVISDKVSFVHVHSVTDNELKEKYMKEYNNLIKQKGSLDFWTNNYQEKLNKINQQLKQKKLSLQTELTGENILGTKSGPTYELYSAIFKRLKNEPLNRKKELFFSTLKMSIPRIFEPSSKTIKMAYIFGNMIGYAKNDGIINREEAENLIDEIQLNLYSVFRVIEPQLELNTQEWDKRTKAWRDIRSGILGN